MKQNHIFTIIIMAALLAVNTHADQTDFSVGEVGAAELGIALGPRPVAMGEAFVAKADDVNATAWNPAGLARMEQYNIGFMHNIYLQDTSLEYLAYTQKLLKNSGIGVNLTYMNYGTFEKLEVVNGIPESNGEFTPYVMTFSGGYGQRIIDDLAVGAAVKYYSQTIDSENYTAFAVDIGGLYKTRIEDLQVGLVVKNLGTQIGEYSIPMEATAGAAYVVPFHFFGQDVWNVLLDVNLPFGDSTYTAVNLGTEYWYAEYALRAGYKFKEQGALGGVSGLTLGFGIKGNMLSLDYAMASYGELGLTHQFAVGVHF